MNKFLRDSPEPDFSHSKKLKIDKPSEKRPEISVEVEKTTSEGSEDEKSEGGCSHQSSEDSSIENIKVFRNGNQLEIWTCDICKCIFLDKVISIITILFLIKISFRLFTVYIWELMCSKQ